MDPNFVRADNTNLPKIDAFMVAHFFKNKADYYAAELKNVKTAIRDTDSTRFVKKPNKRISIVKSLAVDGKFLSGRAALPSAADIWRGVDVSLRPHARINLLESNRQYDLGTFRFVDNALSGAVTAATAAPEIVHGPWTVTAAMSSGIGLGAAVITFGAERYLRVGSPVPGANRAPIDHPPRCLSHNQFAYFDL
ncbi:hypothetical protein EVAR_40812_1 [Eumeta japonica]|uniref:Uncharacterized protein n=1 Tax=Eumeta variegata TaxID=151549 RepID=A0A4C1WHD7_EUMVA|nr:hypothetical protein EVAR_40812_1 [Eumeta japonica]